MRQKKQTEMMKSKIRFGDDDCPFIAMAAVACSSMRETDPELFSQANYVCSCMVNREIEDRELNRKRAILHLEFEAVEQGEIKYETEV